MNKRHYEHTLPNIRGSLSNTYNEATKVGRKRGEKNTHEAECLRKQQDA